MKTLRLMPVIILVWAVFTYLSTTSPLVNLVLRFYETPYQPVAQGKTYDCALVLSGASYFDRYSQALQLNDAAERLTEPVILYRKGVVKKLLISGGSASAFPPFQKEALYVRQFWLNMGIPDSAILVEAESRNTLENAQFSKNLLQKSGAGSKILLVTSALHMPRSKYIFEKAGIRADPYPVDFMIMRGRKWKFDLRDYLIPKSTVLSKWEALIHEWVGMLAARF